jgi:hypothetical protein
VNLDRRHGRYRVLPHKDAGFEWLANGTVIKTAANIRNEALFSSRFPRPEGMTMDARLARSEIKTDGLSSLTFSVVSRDRLPDAGSFSVEKITVAI